MLEAIERRHLADQIDCVLYSSGFPWGITLDSDIRKFTEELARLDAARGKSDGKPGEAGPAAKREWPKILTATGSLTGLTYLWRPVNAGTIGLF